MADQIANKVKIHTVGEIKWASEIWPEKLYTNPKSRYHKFIWTACPKCGKERWLYQPERKAHGRCLSCAKKGHLGANKGKRGQKSSGWRGGRIKRNGYISVWLSPDDFFHPMAKQSNYVLEHRLVMAKHLGRCLHSWELVHHKNHKRDDNKIENLQLVSDTRHIQITILESRIAKLEARVTLLEGENTLLRLRVHEYET